MGCWGLPGCSMGLLAARPPLPQLQLIASSWLPQPPSSSPGSHRVRSAADTATDLRVLRGAVRWAKPTRVPTKEERQAAMVTPVSKHSVPALVRAQAEVGDRPNPLVLSQNRSREEASSVCSGIRR